MFVLNTKIACAQSVKSLLLFLQTAQSPVETENKELIHRFYTELKQQMRDCFPEVGAMFDAGSRILPANHPLTPNESAVFVDTGGKRAYFHLYADGRVLFLELDPKPSCKRSAAKVLVEMSRSSRVE